jgi:hypothetical protein
MAAQDPELGKRMAEAYAKLPNGLPLKSVMRSEAKNGGLHPGAQGVRMVLTFDAMHDDQWTKRALMGWENELGKLAKALAA